MPTPVVFPRPPSARARFDPLLAQEASYLAASAKIRNFCFISTCENLDERRSPCVLNNSRFEVVTLTAHAFGGGGSFLEIAAFCLGVQAEIEVAGRIESEFERFGDHAGV